MSTCVENPILIESDNDSDVEILHEEKNEDLDLIFVSETIHVKDDEKSTQDKTKVECSHGNQDVGFNRSLSISSNLDLHLRLNDNSAFAPIGSADNVSGASCPALHTSILSDSYPLNLSTTKAKYDDISDTSADSGDEGLDDETDDSISDSDSDSLSSLNSCSQGLNVKPVLFKQQLDNSLLQNSLSYLKPKPLHDYHSYNLPSGDLNAKVNNACNGNTCMSGACTSQTQRNNEKKRILLWKSYAKNDHEDNAIPVVKNVDLFGQNDQNNILSKSGMSKYRSDANTVQSQDVKSQQKLQDCKVSNHTTCLSNQNTYINTSIPGTSTSSNSSSYPSTSSQSKSFSDVFNELVQDLDFLSNDYKTASNTTCASDTKTKTAQCESEARSGIKRSLSEQTFKSKQDDKILPPKKQIRYLYHQGSVDSCDSTWKTENCCQCMVVLLGVKLSRCLQGHPTCTNCLEEKVKVVLTGKVKESLHCLKAGCDSYYPISELNQSLPKMVVDILETKLDEDHVEYISNMLLKNASSSDSSAPNTTTKEVPVSPEPQETSSQSKSKTENNLPEGWAEMDKKKVFDFFKVEPESSEYINVATKFHASMIFPSADIVKISRIQNPILWQYFSVKRSEMIQENEGLEVEERKLFHGTQSAVLESICKKGFDWRVCGKNGTVYGQGSYFAVNASYSHQYTDKGVRGRRILPVRPPPAHSGTRFDFSLFQPSQNLGLIGQPSAVLLQNGPSSSCTFQVIRPNGNQNQNPSGSQTNQPPGIVNMHQTRGIPINVVQPGAVTPHQPSVFQSRFGMPNFLSIPPSLSVNHEPPKPLHKMILSRVLVGKYTGGHANLRKPPPLFADDDLSGRCYDSCVDHIHEPKIFVIFDSAQAYPEYLVEYHYEG